MRDAATLLDAAADMVDRGWCRGRMRDRETGDVCAAGAIRIATNSFAQWPADHLAAAEEALAAVLAEQYPTVGGYIDASPLDRIIHINDHHATGPEMAACMRKAAANLRGTVQ